MFEMVRFVAEQMQVAYPELKDSANRVADTVLREEEQFARVLASGTAKLEQAFFDLNLKFREEMSSIYEFGGSEPDGPVLGGREAFSFYETLVCQKTLYKVPPATQTLASTMKVSRLPRKKSKQRARASWKGGSQKSASPAFRELPKTEFEGYTALRVDGARVLALVKDGLGVPALAAGEAGEAVLDATSFYADSGGQVGDVGKLFSSSGSNGGNTVVADVSGATKPVQGVFAHRIVARQTIAVGDVVDTVVDRENRLATERNHTGTHLLHAALREVLGPHVKQAGSLNDPTRLRFDFSHFAQIAEPELREIESIVNQQVLANERVETLVDVPIDVAVNELGAMALFGEKYGDRVRVVKIGSFSTELCGGTHTGRRARLG